MTEQLMKKDEASGLMLINEESMEIKALDKLAGEGVSISKMQNGFVKTVKTANFIVQARAALTDQVMDGIMSLQNSEIGFKTDKKEGYPVAVVRDCTIMAMAMGLQMAGNQINIIESSTYVAKNGANVLLKNLGIPHFEDPGIPELHSEKDLTYTDKYSGGTKTRRQTIYRQPVKVTWRDAEGEHTEEVSFLINCNNAMGPDALAGKATRKARMWLVNRITGMDLHEVEDDDERLIDVTPQAEEKPKGRFMKKDKPAAESKPQPAATTEQNPADQPPQQQTAAPDALEPLRKALAELKVTDMTAEDISAAYAETGNPFDVTFAATNAIACVNWVRDYRKRKEAGDGQQQ